MCQNHLDEIAALKRELEQAQIAYDVLLISQTSYVGRLREEIRKLRVALAAERQNQENVLTALEDSE